MAIGGYNQFRIVKISCSSSSPPGSTHAIPLHEWPLITWSCANPGRFSRQRLLCWRSYPISPVRTIANHGGAIPSIQSDSWQLFGCSIQGDNVPSIDEKVVPFVRFLWFTIDRVTPLRCHDRQHSPCLTVCWIFRICLYAYGDNDANNQYSKYSIEDWKSAALSLMANSDQWRRISQCHKEGSVPRQLRHLQGGSWGPRFGPALFSPAKLANDKIHLLQPRP